MAYLYISVTTVWSWKREDNLMLKILNKWRHRVIPFICIWNRIFHLNWCSFKIFGFSAKKILYLPFRNYFQSTLIVLHEDYHLQTMVILGFMSWNAITLVKFKNIEDRVKQLEYQKRKILPSFCFIFRCLNLYHWLLWKLKWIFIRKPDDISY